MNDTPDFDAPRDPGHVSVRNGSIKTPMAVWAVVEGSRVQAVTPCGQTALTWMCEAARRGASRTGYSPIG